MKKITWTDQFEKYVLFFNFISGYTDAQSFFSWLLLGRKKNIYFHEITSKVFSTFKMAKSKRLRLNLRFFYFLEEYYQSFSSVCTYSSNLQLKVIQETFIKIFPILVGFVFYNKEIQEPEFIQHILLKFSDNHTNSTNRITTDT